MYQEIIGKCKQAYSNKNLSSAYKYYIELYKEFDKNLDNIKDKQKCYQDFYKILEQFTNEEIYSITDYGKRVAHSKCIRW